MTGLEGAYTLALRALRGALPLVARGEGKLARGIRGRRGVLDRMAAWASNARDPERPLVWLHAPSVGEGLQARAVLEMLRERRPEVQVVYTFFSPSAESFARRLPADFADYLPLDLPADAGRALDLLRPDVLAFSKTDVWPNLTREAKRRGVALALLSATLPASSSRMRSPARRLLLPSYRRLDRVAAISAADAARFEHLGVPAERRLVMGDARFDQVWRRAAEADLHSALLAPLRDPDRVVLVAGSTWPPDEERLVEALARIHADSPGAVRLILVPHEPTPEHLGRSEELLARQSLSAVRLSRLQGQAPAVDVVVVDRVGILGDLYAVADLAYVGGGWGSAGLHSVLEPAAFAAPVLFGPRFANSREAGELIAVGGAWSVESGETLEDRIGELLRDPEGRRRAGEAARRYVEAGLGAAARGAEVVIELMDDRRSSTGEVWTAG